MSADLATIAVTTVGGLIGATGALYGAALKSANNSYKEDANALRGLLETKEAIIAEQAKQVNIMEGGIKILRDTIGASPDIARLSIEIATQHKEVLKELSNVASSINGMAKGLTAASQVIANFKRRQAK